MTTTKTFTTRKGMTVETRLTDAEAVEILKTIDDEFPRDLVRKHALYGLSHDQLAWAHKLALNATTPRPAAVNVGSMAGVLELFRRARAHLRHPKVRLRLEDGRCIRLSLAGQRSRFPGCVQVVIDDADRTWLGRIRTNGRWEPSRGSEGNMKLSGMLARFASEPYKVAAEYGKLMSHCCFCNRPLTTDQSKVAGYGADCAGNYGLPYPTQAEAGAELRRWRLAHAS
jgi:hypothetical protein